MVSSRSMVLARYDPCLSSYSHDSHLERLTLNKEEWVERWKDRVRWTITFSMYRRIGRVQFSVQIKYLSIWTVSFWRRTASHTFVLRSLFFNLNRILLNGRNRNKLFSDFVLDDRTSWCTDRVIIMISSDQLQVSLQVVEKLHPPFWRRWLIWPLRKNGKRRKFPLCAMFWVSPNFFSVSSLYLYGIFCRKSL